MIHLFNGDGAATVFASSGIGGAVLVWRESLNVGPVLQQPREEFLDTRASFLASEYEVLDECRERLATQETALDEVEDDLVIWVECDLACQLTFAYAAQRLAERNFDGALSLITVGDFPGRARFRGLGELTPPELASLFPRRQPVGPPLLSSAREAWLAYTNSNPRLIVDYLATVDVPDHIARCFNAHLDRFPDSRRGIGSVEETTLRIAGAAATSFAELFGHFLDELPLLGFGDLQLFRELERMARSGLIDLNAAVGTLQESVRVATLTVTDHGRAVLAGNASASFDEPRWLGGANLIDGWCWNRAERRFDS